jgi:CBS domain-containing protein
MASVAQLLENKGNTVYSIEPDASVFGALERMAAHNIGALPVLDGDRLVGLVSERDYARKVILKGHHSRDTRVRDIMSEQVTCAAPSDEVQQCLEIVTEKRVRHLPVLEDGRLVGLVSIGDLVKSIIDEQQFVIDQMTQYITG